MTASSKAAALISAVFFLHGKPGSHMFLRTKTEGNPRLLVQNQPWRKPQKRAQRFIDPSTLALYSKKSRKPKEDNDVTILAADVAGVVVACQLLGLADVLNDGLFWSNGGWFQPIPAIPASLSVLVQRISLNLLSIGTASFVSQAYKPRSVDSLASIQETGVRIVALYGLIRTLILMGVVLAAANDSLDASMLLAGEALREVYCVSLATLSARYVVYLLYYR